MLIKFYRHHEKSNKKNYVIILLKCLYKSKFKHNVNQKYFKILVFSFSFCERLVYSEQNLVES